MIRVLRPWFENRCTVPLCKSKLVYNRSCPILVSFWRLFWVARVMLVLKTVLKIIRGQLLSEKMLFENRWLWPKFVSVLEPRVTSIARLGFSIFSKPSYFCIWNFVSADKAQLALSAETKLHIQKCNTCRDIEDPSRTIRIFTMVQYTMH